MRDVAFAYTDGGVVGPNPSRLGVTWAYCWVAADGATVLHRASGAATPQDLDVVLATNNHSELYAALRCLEHLGQGWGGTLYTDSSCTMKRLTAKRAKYTNVPAWMIERTEAVRAGRKYRVELVAGHPTVRDLNKGVARRNGMRVSEFNRWCDLACRAAGQLLRESA